MSEKLSASDNPANREHMCAKQVVHEKWGRGDCIPTMHADPTKEGIVEWYDVMFPHGIETRVPTKDLKVTFNSKHQHHMVPFQESDYIPMEEKDKYINLPIGILQPRKALFFGSGS